MQKYEFILSLSILFEELRLYILVDIDESKKTI